MQLYGTIILRDFAAEYCPSAQAQSAGDLQRQALQHFPDAFEPLSLYWPDLPLLQAEDGTEQATVDPDPLLIARSALTAPRSQGASLRQPAPT